MNQARERGVVPSTSAMTPFSRGQDCAPELYRCRAGSIERSLGGFVPENCEGTVEQCTCPWAHVVNCANDGLCAKDDLEIALLGDSGTQQLCAPPANENAAIIGGALPPNAACDDPHELRCNAGVVFRCESPLKLLATCMHGCAVAELPSDVEDRAAVMLACKR